MSPQRYRALLSYLPGMAVVVNAFQSPDVQRKVYEELIGALNGKLENEGAGTDARSQAKSGQVNGKDGEIMHDLAEGGSIHHDLPRV